MGEGLVGFSHTVNFITLFHGAATAFGGLQQLVCQALSHGLLTTLFGSFFKPPHCQSLPAHWPQASITLQRDGHRMQFLLQRPGLGQPLPAGALPLAVGAPLDWTTLPADSCFVLQLPAA